MKTPILPLALLCTAAATAPAAASDVRWTSESALPAAGCEAPALSLELRGAGAGAEVLLHGGRPGALAVIFAGRGETAFALPDGTELAFRPESTVRAVFGPDGAVRIPVGALPEELGEGCLRVQGHVPSGRATSDVLEVCAEEAQPIPVVSPEDEAGLFDVFRPRFPGFPVLDVETALYGTELERMLALALNSPGDELKLGIQGELSVAVYGVKIGGSLELEVQAQRGETGYELSVDRKFGAIAGFELKKDVEAAAKNSLGVKQVYTFDTVPALAKGVRGLILAQAFPPTAIERLGLDDDLAAARDEVRAEMQRVRLALRAQLDQVEAAMRWLIGALERTPRWARGPLRAHLGGLQHVRNALRVTLEVALAAEQQARAIADEVHEVVEAARETVRGVLELRRFVLDHETGAEISIAGGGELEAKVAQTGAKLQVEGSTTLTFRFPASDGAPTLLTTKRKLMMRGDVSVGGGGEKLALSGVRSIEQVVEASIDGSDSTITGQRLTIARDVWLEGVLHYRALMAGRARSVTLEGADVLAAAEALIDAIANDDVEAAVQVLGTVPVTLKVQDRLGLGLVGELGFSAAGNGGKVAASARWVDRGPGASIRIDGAFGLMELLREATPEAILAPLQEGLARIDA